jgi:uncharacterized RDD family membrane protein YckC
MTAWWYVDKNKKIGPIETDELKRLLQSGKIGAKTMLWHEGMDVWRPLDQVEELNGLKAVVPPPLLPKADPDPLSYPLATRWPRFFARIFDVWWETLLIGLILGAVLGRYSASFVEWLNGPGASQLFSILCLPIALILDALLYRAVENTPGKALLGLKVGTLDGKPLSLAQYLNRNLSMWASGLALGFPLINLFTMANQSGRLGKGQQASYDEPTGFRVRSKPSGWVRKTTFGFAFAGLFVIMAVLNTMEQTAQREAILSTAQKNYSWENPLTRLTAKIDSRWKHSAQTNGDGQQIYMFSERADRAVVILGVEQAPGYALDDYVSAFQKSTATNMRFSDGGRFFERDGRQTWQGTGSMVDSTSNRLNVQIIQIGSAFWRVVTIQTLPYDYSDTLVGQLHAVLWGTVK